jgi:uncharacterized protein YifN (PemK superfamily)
MTLPYLPKPGEVLICGFDSAAFGAEMIKRRPVVVVSVYKSHHRQLCTVVPISTTAPHPVMDWHHPLPVLQIPGWKATGTAWAKCDMLATVSFERLNAPYLKSRTGGRRYASQHLDGADLEAIRACVRVYLGL